MKVGIAGGGVTGLTLGYYLSGSGHDVTIFERMKETGGLASTFAIGGTPIERYYHHFFTSDEHLSGLLSELGMQDKVRVLRTGMGVFYDGKVYLLGTPMDVLRFRPFGITDKIRFGLSILRMRMLKDWENLEDESAVGWLQKNAGKKVYEVLWKPLFRAKFGEKSGLISASWLWGRVNARAKSRSGGMGHENLCYLSGSFGLLISELERRIVRNGGKIKKSTRVERILMKGGKVEGLMADGKKYAFDRVISTVHTPEFLKTAKGLPREYAESLERTQYQGVVCAVLEMDTPLSDIYWLNVCDDENPLGVVIEHTNFVGKENYGGRHVVYLASYVSQDSKLMSMPEEKVFSLFFSGLQKIFPQAEERSVRGWHIFRSTHATPVYKRNYSRSMPKFQTPVEGLCIANTSQIYPQDRNVSNSIGLAKKLAAELGAKLPKE